MNLYYYIQYTYYNTVWTLRGMFLEDKLQVYGEKMERVLKVNRVFQRHVDAFK
jgi:hypothetical protein